VSMRNPLNISRPRLAENCWLQPIERTGAKEKGRLVIVQRRLGKVLIATALCSGVGIAAGAAEMTKRICPGQVHGVHITHRVGSTLGNGHGERVVGGTALLCLLRYVTKVECG
jgi:hypothetical protein